MKFLAFSFKNEAMWMMILSFGPIVAAVFILLLVWLVRSLL
jgi:type III secretory pathway component EscS